MFNHKKQISSFHLCTSHFYLPKCSHKNIRFRSPCCLNHSKTLRYGGCHLTRCWLDFKHLLKMKNKKNPDLVNSWNQSTTGSQEDEEGDPDEEELNSINNQLDQLNNALDELEQKNDNIQAQLVQLLETNRQARKQFQQMQNQSSNPLEKKDQPGSS